MSDFDKPFDALLKERWAAGRREHGRPGDGGFTGDELEQGLQESADSILYARVAKRHGHDAQICDRIADLSRCTAELWAQLEEMRRMDDLAGRFVARLTE